MGSVGFCGESESQPSTSTSKKFKSPRKILDECYAANHAAIPRKLRSAIKKRKLESMTPRWPVSKKQNRENGVEILRKNLAKKSKLNAKQGRVTKDEKEVAETLYLLANMFYDATKNDEQGLDVHLSETNSLTVLETASTMTAAQDAGKIAARVTPEAICQTSNLEDPTSKIAQFKSFDDPRPSKLPISQQYPIPFASGDRSDLFSGSRTKMSALTTLPSVQGITMEQVVALGTQNCHREDKNNDLLIWRPSLTSTVTQGTETLDSCPRSSIDKLPAWFETTNHIIQHHTREESLTKNKHHLVKGEPTRLRKRCSAHVYISHLIKVMQVLERKEGLPETRFEPRPHANIDGYKRNGINNTSGALSFTVSSIQDTILLRKSLFQDQQQASKMPASCSPLQQGSDFLSLAGHGEEVLKQFHLSYMESQNNLAMQSHPLNCYSTFHDQSSDVATQQLPPFHSSRLGSRVAALFPSQSHPAGLPTSYLPDWKTGELDSSFLVNCSQGQSLFPHLQSTPGMKNQHFPQQQLNGMLLPPPLPNMKGHSLRLPSGFDRNTSTCYPGSMSQLQILNNQQHLRRG